MTAKTMSRLKAKDANCVSHLINRQIGENVHNFKSNLLSERLGAARSLYRSDLLAHYGCVNAIEFSADGELLISGGDDRRVMLWKLEESIAGISEPQAMRNQHYSNIFCLSFNNDNSKIFSGGNDDVVMVHDVKTAEPFDVFLHSKPVYGLSVDMTNDQIFATAGEDGRILVFDLRIGTQVLSLPKSRSPYHAVQFHPFDGNFAVTANGKDGAALWDLRDYDMPIIRYGGQNGHQSCMSVRFNTHGSQVLALRRRLPPILFNTFSEDSICQFYHPDYYNSCTMKSCTFAGENDEYVLSGSDDFNLYVWRASNVDYDKTNQWVDRHHMVLYGHRSIVNQVRYNSQKCLIASSGVEKVIKLWCPFQLDGWLGNLEVAGGPTNAREIFSHEEYVSLLNASGQNMTHDYSQQNTSEDPRMMAFFDSLVQREIEGWNSNDSSDTDKSSRHSSDGSSHPTSTLQSESDSTASQGLRNRPSLKSRSRYMNRIAYLIATKRKTLKRLALKGSVQTISRRVKSLKSVNRKMPRSSARSSRKNKRLNRLGNAPRFRSRDRMGNNSDTELPKNIAKRRSQMQSSLPPHRNNRRISKLQYVYCANYESIDSSSSDDEARGDTANGSSTSKTLPQANETTNNGNDRSPTRFPIPSTSTGITSNGSRFRVTQMPDSDDDPTPQNSPPSSHRNSASIKLNGHNSTTTANVYSSGVDDEQPNESRHSRRLSAYHYGNFSSHSSSRLSNSSTSDDDDASSDDSAVPFFCKNNNQSQAHTSQTMASRLERTPIASRSRDIKECEYTPDSGIATTPGSSKHFSDGNNNANGNRSYGSGSRTLSNIKNNHGDNDTVTSSMKLFQQNVTRIRRNFRNIGEASYSEDSD